MADDNEIEEREFDFLSTIKVMLGISDESADAILRIYIQTVSQSILNYCNISELPSALNFILCQMVVDIYNDMKSRSSTGSVVGNVQSISEDGRTVSFTNGSEFKTVIEDRIAKTRELNRYKKLFRVWMVLILVRLEK